MMAIGGASSAQQGGGRQAVIRFLAHFLIIIAAWTLVIKFAFPMAFAIAEGVPITTYILWDFWWVAHLWLAWWLLDWRRYTVPLAIVVSVAEIAIIVVKFWLFLSAPEWTIWTTNWFINKLFVLACFLMLLPAVLTVRGRQAAPTPSYASSSSAASSAS